MQAILKENLGELKITSGNIGCSLMIDTKGEICYLNNGIREYCNILEEINLSKLDVYELDMYIAAHISNLLKENLNLRFLILKDKLLLKEIRDYISFKKELKISHKDVELNLKRGYFSHNITEEVNLLNENGNLTNKMSYAYKHLSIDSEYFIKIKEELTTSIAVKCVALILIGLSMTKVIEGSFTRDDIGITKDFGVDNINDLTIKLLTYMK